MAVFQNMHVQIKKSSANVGLVILKIFTAFVIGLTLTMVGQQMLGYGQFLFWFVIALSLAIFMKMAKPLNFTGMFVLIFICILIGLLLKLYVQVAPN